jgi:hypothetical protein
MAGIFSKPKTPPPPPPIEMPQQAKVDETQLDRERGDMMRRRRGRAATVLTSDVGGGDLGGGSVATKSLLGQ